MVDAPVLLVGDIDRGGVFAQLLGTLMLLTDGERERVKGLIINKFRGDASILEPGIQMLEERGNVPVTGVVPYMELSLEDEDSLSERFLEKEVGLIDIAVIHYPRISNFTDFHVFEQIPGVSVRYVTSVRELQHPDLIFLPGSKNTMGDLKWMRQNGLEAAIKQRSEEVPVFGICGGYQMLGVEIRDPAGVEEGGNIRGMELLPVLTVLQKEKKHCQTKGNINMLPGILYPISACAFEGYEIHMGETTWIKEGKEKELEYEPEQKKSGQTACEVVVTGKNPNVYGSYIHGLFDTGNIADRIVQALAEKKGVTIKEGMSEDYHAFKERQYDQLADTLREYLNMEEIYGMLREAHLE